MLYDAVTYSCLFVCFLLLFVVFCFVLFFVFVSGVVGFSFFFFFFWWCVCVCVCVWMGGWVCRLFITDRYHTMNGPNPNRKEHKYRHTGKVVQGVGTLSILEGKETEQSL